MDTRRILETIAAADGGVVSRRAALRAGANSAEIERLRRHGELVVIRSGWYQLPHAQPLVVAAVRTGAALSCVSALPFHHGVWVPPHHTTHLRRPRHLAGAGSNCRGLHRLPPPIRAVDPLPQALQCAANCLPADEFVAVLDSTLRIRRYNLSDLRELFDPAPQRIIRLLGMLDPHSGSGTESIVRYRLRTAGIRVRSQQSIAGVGRVDLLVGDKLIIECDSQGFHGSNQRRNDNRRDRAATRGDYRVMRIDYTEILYSWDEIFADILDLVRTGRHLGKVRPVNSADQVATRRDLAS